MAASTRLRDPMDMYVSENNPDPQPSYRSHEFESNGSSRPSAGKSGYSPSLWETAVANIQKRLPPNIDSSDPPQILETICTEAENRKEESKSKEHKVKLPGKSGKEVKLRDVYGSILSCAKRFRDVGDIAIQASPPQAALPWAIVRLCLTAAFNEHEMYGVMIQGLEMVSSIVTHYVVIERIFIGEESTHAKAVRNSLLALYAAVLDFLFAALKFFPPPQKKEEEKKGLFREKLASGADKVRRTFQSLDATYQATVKDLLNTVSKRKDDVDSDSNHAYSTMNLDAIKRSEKFQAQIGKQLDAMGLAEAERDRRLSIVLTEFERPLESIDDKVSELYEYMEQSQQKAQYRQVLDWLTPAVQESKRKTYHQSLSGHRLPFSGAWLFQDPDYLSWQNSDKSSVAWLSGTSGTGKTMLLSIVIDHILDQISNVEGPERIAFFYASAKPEVSSWADPSEVIRNIVRQLSHTATGMSLEPVIKQKYDELVSASNEPLRLTMSECTDMIVALASKFPIVIVVDALDELDPGDINQPARSSRNDFIECMNEMMRRSSNSVKVLLSALTDSPAETRLRNVFAKEFLDWHSIELNATKNSNDIINFIDDMVTKKIKKCDLLAGQVGPDLKTRISKRLFERSKGMFRYANMQIEPLCDDRMNESMVLEELEKPLPEITSLYQQSITEIRNEPIERVHITVLSTLRWLTCVQEALPVQAFLEAVSVEGGIDKPTQSNLHSACRMLVKTDHDHATDSFAFAHPSMQEYLEAQPGYSPTDCHLVAADRCLRMMTATSTSRRTPGQIRLGWYAKIYWPLHYQNINFNLTSKDEALNEEREKGFARVKTLLKNFVYKTSQAFGKWLQEIPDFVKELGQEHPLSRQLTSIQASLVTPLHAICVFGFADLIDMPHKHFDFAQRNAHGQTALCLAVENDQLDTVKALLASNRVDVNEFNVRAVQQLLDEDFRPVICYANAMQAAALQGSKSMIQTLIDYGARVDLVAGYYGNALQAACLAGHVEVVDFLLNGQRFDPNTQGGFHGNALQAASSRGHLEVVNILIEAKAYELTPGGHFGSAIMAATHAGSKGVIDSLLKCTNDVKVITNAKNQRYGTPLQQAVDMNREDIVDVLIVNQADINAFSSSKDAEYSNRGASALAIAAFGGNKKMVSILCKLNAEADLSHSENQFHLLHQAALQNMEELVQYCINEGCDLNLTTDSGRKYHAEQGKMTPLAFACAEGHMNIVKVLLEKGARIQYPGDVVPSLHLAASRGHAEVVEALIEEHKARHPNNPKATLDLMNRRIPGSQDAALHEAARAGAADAVAKLLKHGAAFLTTKLDVGPLHCATWEGRPVVVKVLVEHLESSPDIDSTQAINARDVNGKSALIDAAYRNRFNIFPYLLDHKADYKVQDNGGHTLLHYVAWRNHHHIAKMLLAAWDKDDPAAKKAWLDRQNGLQSTGLQEALYQRHFPIVRMLLDASAEVTPSNRGNFIFRINKETSLEEARNAIAAFGDHQEELVKFLNHRSGEDGFSLLHDAAVHDRLDIAQVVLQHGADVTTMKTESVNSGTPLHHAVCLGRMHIVKLLLNHASQHCDKSTLSSFVDHRNDWGKTALVYAAERNLTDYVKLLLSKPYSADWAVVDNNKQNALHWSAWRGHKPCVEILLRYASGAEGDGSVDGSKFRTFLNQQNNVGGSPLTDVSFKGYEDLARMFLYEYHAEYETYNQWGDSILHNAVQGNHDELLKLYLEYMANDKDQEKFKRVLHHKNKSMNRTVLEALDVRGRKQWADYVRKFGA